MCVWVIVCVCSGLCHSLKQGFLFLGARRQNQRGALFPVYSVFAVKASSLEKTQKPLTDKWSSGGFKNNNRTNRFEVAMVSLAVVYLVLVISEQ